MGKVFGYPEFDEHGEQILTTYDNDYKEMMMDIRVYRMKEGDVKTFCKKGEETAVLLPEMWYFHSMTTRKKLPEKTYLLKVLGQFMYVPALR